MKSRRLDERDARMPTMRMIPGSAFEQGKLALSIQIDNMLKMGRKVNGRKIWSETYLLCMRLDPCTYYFPLALNVMERQRPSNCLILEPILFSVSEGVCRYLFQCTTRTGCLISKANQAWTCPDVKHIDTFQ